MNHIAILGRQPELGLAELESTLGPANIKPLGQNAVYTDSAINIARYGMIVKSASSPSQVSSGEWRRAITEKLQAIINSDMDTAAKINCGISFYGKKLPQRELQRFLIGIKKHLRTSGINLRIVPNKQPQLSSAQVIHNKLTSPKGLELLCIFDGNQLVMAKTQQIQDIADYSRRDRDKPRRDPTIGMLPPKVAQLLINLSGAQPNQIVLDPFCGSGTVLMETLLQGMAAYGSDISADMIAASKANLEWLQKNYKLSTMWHLEKADARQARWDQPFDTVASEIYLGPPLNTLPAPGDLKRITDEISELLRKFLLNIAEQLRTSQRLCLAVPAWQDASGRLRRLPIVDDLEKLGYNRASFHLTSNDLVYRRPSQVVARQIIVLEKR